MKPLCDPAPHQEDFEGCGEAFAGNKYYLMHGIGRGKYGMVYEVSFCYLLLYSTCI
eukprot:SAG31_NODE_250_length_19098_cov_4.337123_9_plen_56_part_00